MEHQELKEITCEELSKMSLKDRIVALEKIMSAAELLVKELGRISLNEECELVENK